MLNKIRKYSEEEKFPIESLKVREIFDIMDGFLYDYVRDYIPYVNPLNDVRAIENIVPDAIKMYLFLSERVSIFKINYIKIFRKNKEIETVLQLFLFVVQEMLMKFLKDKLNLVERASLEIIN
mgnify:CR=1 FL=1